jgi:hypothetical protein
MKGIGSAAIEASTDPLIALVKAGDSFARAARRQIEEGVDAVIDRNQELVAQARFAVLGETVYHDATFTLRVSFGTVKAWTEAGRPVLPFTTLGGLYDRVTGSDPFVLPARWAQRKSSVKLDTPFNLAADTDIIGGNSGSPMIDRDGRIVGLVFDGNIHSIGGEYWFDETKNRTVAVDSRGIREALKSVYQADRIPLRRSTLRRMRVDHHTDTMWSIRASGSIGFTRCRRNPCASARSRSLERA